MDHLFLSKIPLFRGIMPDEIQVMLSCLEATVKHYDRGEIIYHHGDTVHAMGLVLSGSVSIENDDIWGNKSILDRVDKGQIFAETYACLPNEPLMISAVAAERCEILFMNTAHMFTVCTNSCSFHGKLIKNMLTLSSQKSLNLSRRILHTSAKTIRGRLLSYLSYQADKTGGREFDIPFNRQELADYLNVERSALSNELSKMQADGLIRTKKNHFVLLRTHTDF